MKIKLTMELDIPDDWDIESGETLYAVWDGIFDAANDKYVEMRYKSEFELSRPNVAELAIHKALVKHSNLWIDIIKSIRCFTIESIKKD